jgi:hypothetical protein
VGIEARVDAAGGDAPKEARAAHRTERLDTAPVGLGQDGNAKAVVGEPTSDEGHAEGRVIDIGVAGNEDDIGRAPAEGVDIGPADGQKRVFTLI